MRRDRMIAALCAALMLTVSVPFAPPGMATLTAGAAAGDTILGGDLTYTILDDGTLSVTKYSDQLNDVELDVVIPGAIGSRIVTRIGDSAFSKGRISYYLRSVKIPSTVTSIGSEAFRNCDLLTTVTIPEGVTSIGDRAFDRCNGLTTVYLPRSVTKIGQGTFSSYDPPTLYLYEDSAAYIYAVENDIPYVLIGGDATLGDVNSDGSIDANDASDILVASTEKAVGHELALTEAQQKAADVNKDGHFDAVDASYILIYSTRKGIGQDSAFGDLFE